MQLKMKTALTTAASATVLALGLAAFAPTASAYTSCYMQTVRINGNPGAESPSWKRGHRHIDWTFKGNNHHYVRYSYYSSSVRKYRYVYYADNNAGWNGDTWDTYYGARYC